MQDDQLVQRHFSANTLSACFDQRFKDGQTPKPDMSFFDTLSRKCLDGTFRFSPYREKIISKGRNKYPRVLCVPSKRDQLVLRKMHDYLRDVYVDIVIQPNGGRIVKAAINFISTLPTDDRWVYRGDIIGFYDEIPRDQLMSVLAERISNPVFLSLVQRALVTPAVPKGTRRDQYYQFKTSAGVPQGLSISNVLANIYLSHVDKELKKINEIFYARFVDDLIILGGKNQTHGAKDTLHQMMEARGLRLHQDDQDKVNFNPIDHGFGYLGYEFRWPLITVRESSVKKLKDSLIKTIHDQNMDLDDKFKKINLRITGAVSATREYGWLFYYRHISDLTLLHKLDSFVLMLLKRQGIVRAEDLSRIKKFSRAHIEIRSGNKNGYIYSFNEDDSELSEYLKSLLEGMYDD